MTYVASLASGARAAVRGTLSRCPDRAALLLVIATALTVRLAFSFRAPTFVVHDSVTYFQAGYEFARGLGFELAFKRTPLYPLLIAAVVALVGEDLQALAFVQHLLGALSAALTFFLGRAIFGRPAGMIAGLLVALSGPLILYEHYVLAEALFIPLLLAFALALVAALSSGRWRWFLVAGVLLGLAGLARPVGQAVVLAVPVSLAVALGSWRRAFLATLIVVVGFVAATAPWMLRNYVKNGSLESAGALGQTLTGRITRHDEGFVIPRPESASPYSDPIRTEARALILRQMAREARPSAINHRLRETYGWTEAEANGAMRDVGLEIIGSQKERYVVGTFAKLRRLLWGEPEDFIGQHWGNRKSNELFDDWVSNASIAHVLAPPTPLQEAEKYNAAAIVGALSPTSWRWPLLMLLMLGLFSGLRLVNRWAVVFLLLVVFSLVIPAAALVGFVPRYRYPVDPFLSVLIAGGTVYLMRQVGQAWTVRRRWRRSGRSVGPEAARAGRPAERPVT